MADAFLQCPIRFASGLFASLLPGGALRVGLTEDYRRFFVSVVHSAAMIATGGLCAWLVSRYLGLKFVSRSWFNLDATWAAALLLVGVVSLEFSFVVSD
jgi:hypothetical protein